MLSRAACARCHPLRLFSLVSRRGIRVLHDCHHGLQLVCREGDGLSWHVEVLCAAPTGVFSNRPAHRVIEGALDLVHGAELRLRVNVGVDVQRHAHRAVVQVARHRAYVHAVGDGHGGEGMAQVVEGALESVHLAERGEVFAQLRGVVGSAVGLLRAQDVRVRIQMAERRQELQRLVLVDGRRMVGLLGEGG